MILPVPLPFECRLQGWRLEDLAGLTEASSDPAIGRYMGDDFPCPYTMTSGFAFIERVMADRPTCAFMIQVEGRVAGAMAVQPGKGIYRIGAELGYWLHPTHWSRGIATNCVSVITGYAFDTWEIGYIYAKVFSSNTASERVLERNGFRCETVLHEGIVKKGIILDEKTYILRRDSRR